MTQTVGLSCATHLLSCLEQSSLDVVLDILSGYISYTCRCAYMQVKDLLEIIALLRVLMLPNFEAWMLVHISPHVAYKKLMLEGYFLARDNFYICDKFVHGPREKDEVYLHGYVAWLVCDEMAVTSRLNAKAYSGSDLPYPIPPYTSLYWVPVRPRWPFQSPHGIRNSYAGILAVTACSWSKNRSLTSSLRSLCGECTDRKVTTCWPTISFTKMNLSETLCSSKTFSIHSSQILLHQQCLYSFWTSRACTWCPCPWLCSSCHHSIWFPEWSRHPLSWGIVYCLSECVISELIMCAI